MNNNVKVSICCTTYNHEAYIRQALDSLIRQEANFKFEIIVHDDASTDNTANIIREFEKQHANIIAVYQTENQYSQGIKVIDTYIRPHIHGEYIAFCEGDDYWTDTLKLQKQIDVLEKNSDCYMCVHRVEEVFVDGRRTGSTFPMMSLQSQKLKSKEFLQICTSDYFQTSSYVFRAIDWKRLIDDPPLFKKLFPVGDAAYLLYFGNLSSVFYMDEIMSAYRRGVQSSWSKKTASDESFAVRYIERRIQAMAAFDEYSGYKYHTICNKSKSGHLFFVAIYRKKPSIFIKKENWSLLKCLPFKKKCFLLFALLLPSLAKKMYACRREFQIRKLGY